MLKQDELNKLERFLRTLYKDNKKDIAHLYVKNEKRIERTRIEKKCAVTMHNILSNDFTNTEYEAEVKYEEILGEDKQRIIYLDRDLTRKLKKLNKNDFVDTADIWFTPHLYYKPFPTRRGGRLKENVAKLTCVFADVDNVPEEDFQKRMSEANLPIPTSVIKSGHGFHAYWALTENIYARTNEEKYVELMQYIQSQLQSDSKIKDMTRMMRLPYSFNNKYEEQLKTEILVLNEEVSYDFDTLYDTFVTTATSLTAEKQKVKEAKKYNEDKQKRSNVKNNYAYYIREDVKKLIKMRKKANYRWKFKRHYTLLTLKSLNFSDKYIEYVNREVFEYPQSSSELDNVLNAELTTFKRETIYNNLAVTKDEEREMKVLINETDAKIKKLLRELEDEERKLLTKYKKYIQINYIHTEKSRNKTNKEIAKYLKITERSVINMSKQEFTNDFKNELCESMLNSIDLRIDMLTTVLNDTNKISEPLQKKIVKTQKRIEKLEKLVLGNEELTAKNKFKVKILKEKYRQIVIDKKVA